MCFDLITFLAKSFSIRILENQKEAAQFGYMGDWSYLTVQIHVPCLWNCLLCTFELVIDYGIFSKGQNKQYKQ